MIHCQKYFVQLAEILFLHNLCADLELWDMPWLESEYWRKTWELVSLSFYCQELSINLLHFLIPRSFDLLGLENPAKKTISSSLLLNVWYAFDFLFLDLERENSKQIFTHCTERKLNTALQAVSQMTTCCLITSNLSQLPHWLEIPLLCRWGGLP